MADAEPAIFADRRRLRRPTDGFRDAGRRGASAEGGMARQRPHHEQVALNMLRRYGLEAIWRLHLSAASVHRQGHKAAALYIAEIADAAEREWQRRAKAGS